MTKSNTNSNSVPLDLVEQNQEEVGRYFKKLLKENLGQWEKRVIFLMARSKAYRNNDLPKLLELANDIKAAHQAQINFVEKYVGDLFAPEPSKAIEMEKEETEFLDRKILPFINQKISGNTK